MPITTRKITPCLWFDTQAEQAANFYVSIFKNSRIGRVSRYGKEGYEIHGKEAGTVMTVEFEIEGQPFVALNGGPHFKFNEAISFQVHCGTQEEIDYYWGKLTAHSASQQRTAGDPIMAGSIGRFVWYELMTTDTEAAEKFYWDVMGWDTWDAGIPDRT
jgi:predicted 3-demethylubiquinone-9 3-methyltransferase (glyoxalase superfamily)